MIKQEEQLKKKKGEIYDSPIFTDDYYAYMMKCVEHLHYFNTMMSIGDQIKNLFMEVFSKGLINVNILFI